MRLSDKIIKHRKAMSWSQEEFAEKLNVSRQAISRWENGTVLPDSQNILQISKLFNVTTDYLLKDDVSDLDTPEVHSETQEIDTLFLKRKHLHLTAAICFSISVFCAIIGIVNSTNDTQLALSSFMLALCTGNAVAQFVLYFKK